MKAGNKWILLAGGPSCGKTTLLNYFAKNGYACKEEQARYILDSFIEEGIPFVSVISDPIVGSRFQDEIAKREITAAAGFSNDKPTFFDRSVLDYLSITKERDLFRDRELVKAANSQTFALAFILDTIPGTFAGNKLESAFTDQFERSQKQTDGIAKVLQRKKIICIKVPVLPLEQRASYILAECQKHNLFD